MQAKSMPNLLSGVKRSEHLELFDNKGAVESSNNDYGNSSINEYDNYTENQQYDSRRSVDQFSNLSLLDLYDTKEGYTSRSDSIGMINEDQLTEKEEEEVEEVEVEEEDYFSRRLHTQITNSSSFNTKGQSNKNSLVDLENSVNTLDVNEKSLNDPYNNASKNSLPRSPITPTRKNGKPFIPMSNDELEHYDRYGFKKKTAFISEQEYDIWWNEYSQYSARRKSKWIHFLAKNGIEFDEKTSIPKSYPVGGLNNDNNSATSNSDTNSKVEKLKRYIRKGIPAEWRGESWWFFANGNEKLSQNKGLYESLVRKLFDSNSDCVLPQEYLKENTSSLLKNDDFFTDVQIIERDLNRTFPENIHFMKDTDQEPTMIISLRKVLYAFALYDQKIGYCQSMNFLAGLLLLFLDEEKTFWMMVIITNEILPNVHNRNLEGVNVDQGVLMLCIKEYLPELWCKINNTSQQDQSSVNTSSFSFSSSSSSSSSSPAPFSNNGSSTLNKKNEFLFKLPPITLCTAGWFMSCFIGIVPIETTLRIWDCVFFEGSHFLFKTSMAIMKLSELNPCNSDDFSKGSLSSSKKNGSNSSFHSIDSENGSQQQQLSSTQNKKDSRSNSTSKNKRASLSSSNLNSASTIISKNITDAHHPLRNSLLIRKFSKSKLKILSHSNSTMARKSSANNTNASKDDLYIELFQQFQTFPKTLLNPNDIFEKIVFKRKYHLNALNQEEIVRCRKYVVAQRAKYKKLQQQQQQQQADPKEAHLNTEPTELNAIMQDDFYGFGFSNGTTLRQRVMKMTRKVDSFD
ncbi:hypothetical protein ACO0QE_000287 [Hanseniaspora vineae]